MYLYNIRVMVRFPVWVGCVVMGANCPVSGFLFLQLCCVALFMHVCLVVRAGWPVLVCCLAVRVVGGRRSYVADRRARGV